MPQCFFSVGAPLDKEGIETIFEMGSAASRQEEWGEDSGENVWTTMLIAVSADDEERVHHQHARCRDTMSRKVLNACRDNFMHEWKHWMGKTKEMSEPAVKEFTQAVEDAYNAITNHHREGDRGHDAAMQHCRMFDQLATNVRTARKVLPKR